MKDTLRTGRHLRGFLLVGMCLVAPRARGDETLATLTVGDDVYTNVTVTGITKTDVYFTYAGGMGNAKLKNLSPDLQQHFHYNSVDSSAAEQKQREANAAYLAKAAATAPKPATAPVPVTIRPVAADEADPVAPRLSARSVRGQPAPEIVVDQWLTSPPETQGKWVLVDFWATWCGPCRESIPHLNGLYEKYKDRVAFIGLTDETAEAVHRMTSPRIDYAVATDPEGRTKKALEVHGIPHLILIDPHGVVRFEGHPGYLSEDVLTHYLGKYTD